MDIFVLRHGQAEAFASCDSERQLTTRGHDEVNAVVTGLLDELSAIETVFVSPFVRAQQTAAVVMKHLPGIERRTTDLLVPEADPVALYDMLQALDQRSVLLVSHQPLVGTLVNSLAGLVPGRYAMGTAALARIETELVAADLGTLRGLYHPTDFLNS